MITKTIRLDNSINYPCRTMQNNTDFVRRYEHTRKHRTWTLLGNTLERSRRHAYTRKWRTTTMTTRVFRSLLPRAHDVVEPTVPAAAAPFANNSRGRETDGFRSAPTDGRGGGGGGSGGCDRTIYGFSRPTAAVVSPRPRGCDRAASVGPRL